MNPVCGDGLKRIGLSTSQHGLSEDDDHDRVLFSQLVSDSLSVWRPV